MKVLALIGSARRPCLSTDFCRSRRGVDRFEFPVLMLLSTLGMMMLISAGDLITLYLGLELMSLALYVLAAFATATTRKSTEAGLKYFVLGALSSGMLLYGASLIYGFTGTVSFAGIAAAVHDRASIGVVFGLVFLLAGLASSLGRAVPHVDARRLRGRADAGHRVLRLRAQGRGDGAVRPRGASTAFPGIVAAVAADHRLRLDRLDGARLLRGHRPDATSSA